MILSFTTPRGVVVKIFPGTSEVLSSGRKASFLFSLLFFSFFFLFSFSIFRYCSFVLFLYIALVFLHLYIFFPIALFPFHPTCCRYPEVLREVLRFMY